MEKDNIMDKIKKTAKENRDYIRKMIADGKIPSVRPLTRKERKAFDKSGMNIMKIKIDDKRIYPEQKEDCADYIIDNIAKKDNPDFDYDSLPNNIVQMIADLYMSLTYHDSVAEKNF